MELRAHYPGRAGRSDAAHSRHTSRSAETHCCKRAIKRFGQIPAFLRLIAAASTKNTKPRNDLVESGQSVMNLEVRRKHATREPAREACGCRGGKAAVDEQGVATLPQARSPVAARRRRPPEEN